MTLLTAGDIARMRDVLDQSLPDTCVIQGGTIVDDLGGGGSTTWANRGTVDCRLSPMTGSEREVADRLSEDAQWLITVPAETVVDTNSRVVISGTSFEVLARRAPRSWEVATVLEAQEVT